MSVVLAEPQTTLKVEKAPLQISFEEYLAEDYEGGLAEWIEGEVIIYMSATETHQKIILFLSTLLHLFVQWFDLGFIRTAPYAMRAKKGGNGREPDLFFVAKEHRSRLTAKFLDGPADLVIEIVSEESVSRDYEIKFHEYQAAGIREYWIIDPRPERQGASFYLLDSTGHYQAVSTAEGIYFSTVLPNFWLKIAWLWHDEPQPLAALAQIVGQTQFLAVLQEAQK